MSNSQRINATTATGHIEARHPLYDNMVLQRNVRSLHSVCSPSEHRFRNFCYYRNSLPYCYHSGCLQDIYSKTKFKHKDNKLRKMTTC